MKIIKVKNINFRNIKKILARGGVIIYPTDTAYALGGIFQSRKVIKRVLQMKKRRDNKFTLVSSSIYQVKKFFKLHSVQKKLAKKFWPGPLSIIVSQKYAVRVPNNFIAQRLARLSKKPLIATSANISGRKTPYSVSEILKQFVNKKNQPDLILDAGRLKKVKISTIVKVDKYGIIEVLRKGAVKI